MNHSESDELIFAVNRYFQRNRLKRKLNNIQSNLQDTEQLISELTEIAKTKLDDVELLKRRGIPRLFFELTGSLEERQGEEEQEAQNAFAKLEDAHESLQVLSDEAAMCERQLDDLLDVDSTLEIKMIELQAAGRPIPYGPAYTVGQTYLAIKEVEEKIAFGEQAADDLLLAKKIFYGSPDIDLYLTSSAQSGIEPVVKYLEQAQNNLQYFNIDFSTELGEAIKLMKQSVIRARNKPQKIRFSIFGIFGILIDHVVENAIQAPSQTHFRSDLISASLRKIEDLSRQIPKLIKTLNQEKPALQKRFNELEQQWNTTL